MRNRVNRGRLPQQQIVVEFNFREVRPAKYWLVRSPRDMSVGLKHPGYEIDILVTTKLAILYQVWFGQIPFEEAIYEEQVKVDASPSLIRSFPKWFALGQAANIVRAVAAT
jgi:hypothetical protein